MSVDYTTPCISLSTSALSWLAIENLESSLHSSYLLQIGPIISGPMAQHSGWRSYWWLNVAMLGATFAAVAIGFPETKWHRIHPNEMLAASAASAPSDEKISAQKVQYVDLEKTSIPSIRTSHLTPTKTAERDHWLHKGAPSKRQFRLFQANSREHLVEYFLILCL